MDLAKEFQKDIARMRIGSGFEGRDIKINRKGVSILRMNERNVKFKEF